MPNSPHTTKEYWRQSRIDCLLAIIDQAKFIKHAINFTPDDRIIRKYVNELHEMVTLLKKFAEEE